MLLANLFFLAKIIFPILIIFWLFSLRTQKVSTIDSFWGTGFVIISWLTFFRFENAFPNNFLLLVLVTVWGLRLTFYLVWRNWNKPEDYRYQAMRHRAGKIFPWLSLFSVFIFQGCLILTISVPLQLAFMSNREWSWLNVLGTVTTIAGILFESVGDYQLAQFKKHPENKGQVFDRGLWRFSRHPNYFGDFLVWWGFYLFALNAGDGWSLFSPLLMSFLLIRVSGVPLLESSLCQRTEGYKDYVNKTSPFFPRRPRKH